MYIDSKAKSPYHNAVTVPFLLSIQCPKYKQFIDLGPRPRIGKYNFDELRNSNWIIVLFVDDNKS